MCENNDLAAFTRKSCVGKKGSDVVVRELERAGVREEDAKGGQVVAVR
jgi:hypothetical protein